MASIRDLYKDPFENYNLLMQKLNRMAYIGEATSAVLKMSGVSSISNVDYLNSMNTAEVASPIYAILFNFCINKL